MKRILFFIDGFNVYHALDDDPKYNKYKWLDYFNLAKRFVSKQDQIVGIFFSLLMPIGIQRKWPGINYLLRL